MKPLCILVPLLLAGFPLVAQATDHVVEMYFAVEPQVLRNYEALGYSSSKALETLKGDVDFFIYQANKYFNTMKNHGLNIEIRAKKIDYLTNELFDHCALFGGKELQVDLALTIFQKWLVDNKIYDTYGFDVAIVLSGYDGFRTPGETTVTGYATEGTVCDKVTSFGFVELTGIQDTAHTLAHELAHSMGAGHDSTILCPPTTGYIMTPATYSRTKNRWSFSTCSVSSIQHVIKNLNDKRKNCLTNTSVQASPFSMDSQKGRDIMDINWMCRHALNDKDAYFCGYHYFYGGKPPSGDQMCQYILCSKKTSKSCSYATPTEGMMCDFGKRCSKGKCVTAPTSFPAPPVTKGCLYGDILSGDVGGSENCEDFINKNGLVVCYGRSIQENCCKTCAGKATGIKDCMYGDKIPNGVCKTYSRNVICPNNMDACCDHCKGFTSDRQRRSAVLPMPALPPSILPAIKTTKYIVKEKQVKPRMKFVE